MDKNLILEIKLPKIPDIKLVAIEGLERMGKNLGIADDKIGEAKLVVTEAIINALEHSGEDNPYVTVEFTMTKEKLIIMIKDSGRGFNPDEFEKPDIKKKIFEKNKRGWGLHIMKSMSDNLIIESEPTGTKISIIKRLN